MIICAVNSPWRGSGAAINVAAVRQALGQHVREHISGGGTAQCPASIAYKLRQKTFAKNLWGETALVLRATGGGLRPIYERIF